MKDLFFHSLTSFDSLIHSFMNSKVVGTVSGFKLRTYANKIRGYFFVQSCIFPIQTDQLTCLRVCRSVVK